MKITKYKRLAILHLSLIVLIGAAALTSACGSAAPPRVIDDRADTAARSAQKPPPPPNQQAIESASKVQITKLDGGTFKLSDFQGKVLVVDFWATYCPPCVKQVPQLAELSKKYQDKGLA
ncbi:MAG: TlpA family protein disulfide reductase, partial [Chloracidobacterium sp.]|nr:TlpA family protein disulfide reductase [Chloracidobacterium sp.]